jgi:hypothetical protein
MSQTNIIKTVFIVLSSVLSYFIWSRFDVSVNQIGFSDMIAAAILIVFSAGLFVLCMFLFSDWTPFAVFGVFLFVFLLVLGINSAYILVVFLSGLLFFGANARIKHNMKNRLKISFHSALVYGVPTILTMLALLVSFASYFYPYNISDIKVQKSSFSYLMPLASELIKFEFPFYEKDMTLDDLIVTNAIIQNGLDPSEVDIKKIKFSLKSQLNKQKKDISERLGVKIMGDEKVDDLLVLSANSYLDKYVKTNQSFIPIIIAIVTFFTIKSFGFILNRLSVFFAWILFKIMLHFGIIRKDVIPEEKEVIFV